jgi:hypothetical protein
VRCGSVIIMAMVPWPMFPLVCVFLLTLLTAGQSCCNHYKQVDLRRFLTIDMFNYCVLQYQEVPAKRPPFAKRTTSATASELYTMEENIPILLDVK